MQISMSLRPAWSTNRPKTARAYIQKNPVYRKKKNYACQPQRTNLLKNLYNNILLQSRDASLSLVSADHMPNTSVYPVCYRTREH